MYDDGSMTSGFEMYYDLIDHRLTVGPRWKEVSNLQRLTRREGSIPPFIYSDQPRPETRSCRISFLASVSNRSYRYFVLVGVAMSSFLVRYSLMMCG